jgi:hypothetical protein
MHENAHVVDCTMSSDPVIPQAGDGCRYARSAFRKQIKWAIANAGRVPLREFEMRVHAEMTCARFNWEGKR